MWSFLCRYVVVATMAFFSVNSLASEALSVYIKASTDTIYHGLSETAGEPSIGINAEWQASELLVFGLYASEGRVDGIRQRHRALTPYIGLELALDEDWFAGTYVQSRRFFDGAREWDFEEFSLTASHQSGLSVRLDYSPDYYASDLSSMSIEVQYQEVFSEPFYYSLGAGYFDLDSQLDYQHANLKLGARYKNYTASLGYHWVSETLRPTPVGPIESPRFVFEIICKCF